MKEKILVAAFLGFAVVSVAQNIQKDIALGKQYSEYVEAAVGVYDNPELTEYIKAIGDKLTDQMDRPLFKYRYTILATPEPNAFSVPGGHLYITTGMFPFLESEDELACIMAHEIIHANNRHVIKSNRRGILPGILQIPGAIIGVVIDENIGNVLQSPFRQLGILTHSSYSRKREIEADIEGIKIAAKAGYDPKALTSILTRIGEYGELEYGEEERDRFATHPMTDHRVEKITSIEPKLDRGELSYLTEDFLSLLDGSLAGRDPRKGVMVEETYLNPDRKFKIVFPEEWELGFMGNTIAGGNEENKEYMRIFFEENEEDPTDAANEYLKDLSPYLKESVKGSRPISVDSRNGHIVVFKEEYEGQTFYGSRTWIREGALLFSFLAVSGDENLSAMEEVIYSLSSTTDADIETIDVPILRVIRLDAKETAKSLIARTKTKLSEKITLLMNEKGIVDEFEKGEKVKIVVPEKL